MIIIFIFKVSTVKYWWSRFQSEGNVLTKPRPGQPNALSANQQREIIEKINKDPFLTATDLARQYQVSIMTITRHLAKNGLHCRTASKQTRLTDEHKINRIAFCETLLEKWDEGKLNSIIFTDEKTFSTDVRWRKKVYRPQNERYNPNYVHEENLSGRINASYWGAISIDGPATDIIRIEGRFNSAQYLTILENHIEPLMRQNPQRIFMHDNSPIHTANIVQEYLGNQLFQTMSWSPLSPDLNPIENVWSHITYDWPKMNQRTDAALHDLVTNRWLALRQERGLHIRKNSVFNEINLFTYLQIISEIYTIQYPADVNELLN